MLLSLYFAISPNFPTDKTWTDQNILVPFPILLNMIQLYGSVAKAYICTHQKSLACYPNRQILVLLIWLPLLLSAFWATEHRPPLLVKATFGGDALEWEDLCIVPWLKLYDSESGSSTIQVTWQQAYLSRHCIQSEVGCMEMEPVGTSCMSHRASIASSCGIGCWN